MFEATRETIGNALQTVRGTHPLFRDFGLNSVDSSTGISRAEVIALIARYYPDVNLGSISGVVSSDGKYNYNISINGD